jgi:hypothetical protein
MASACCLSLSFLAALMVGGQGRAPVAPKDKPEFIPDAVRAAATAAGAVGMRDPSAVMGILLTAKAMEVWDTLPVVPIAPALDRAEPVDPAILAEVQDRSKVHGPKENYSEFLAYNYLLVLAHKTPAQALARGARRDLTFAHLFEEPKKYRGQIVHIEGRLKRLRKFDAEPIAAKEGVSVLYEGWIFDESLYYNPFCVIVSEVPKSIEVGEKIDYEVAFDGYFFKRYRYPAGDGVRDAPLLIGRTLARQTEPRPALESPGSLLLYAFLAVLGVTAALGIVLGLWFRRGDKRVQAHLDAARNAGFIDPGELEDSSHE